MFNRHLVFRNDIRKRRSHRLQVFRYSLTAGVRYSIGTGSRKCSKAEVILREGTGRFLINGDEDGIDFFDGVLERMQILTPFSFLGRIGEFDVEAEVKGGGELLLRGK